MPEFVSAGAGPVALIAGNGRIPLQVAKALQDAGRDFLVVAIKGEADEPTRDFATTEMGWGEVGRLHKFLKKTRKVQREYLTKIGWYKTALEEHHEQQFIALNNQLETTQDFVDQLTLQFGTEYHKTSVSNLKIFKTFSGKSKIALDLKSKILNFKIN